MKKWILAIICIFFAAPVFAEQVRGIYINAGTMQGGNIPVLIQRAKETGINTFVIDYIGRPSALYKQNLALIQHSGIHYVARIVVFPDGGTPDRVHSLDYREKKYELVKAAVDLGAEAIQLDYIRYNTSLGHSNQHVTDINNVIAWFRDRLRANRRSLEVDVFGITSFGPEKNIGQDVRQIAQYVDTLCPMNYPSHFQPFSVHSSQPWRTVYNALTAMKEQLNNHVPVNIVAWIEMSNYHYILTGRARQQYIAAQIRAVNDADVTGWYAWSPKNQYDNLFQVLKSGQDKNAPQS